MGEETRKPLIRAGLSVIGLVFAIAAAAVDNGFFTWKVDDTTGLYWERSCISQSPCFNDPNDGSAPSDPSATTPWVHWDDVKNLHGCKGCDGKIPNPVGKGTGLRCDPDLCYRNAPQYRDLGWQSDTTNTVCSDVNATDDKGAVIPGQSVRVCKNQTIDACTAATCLDLSENPVGEYTVSQEDMIKTIDFKCGIFRSSVNSKGDMWATMHAIDDILSKSGMLCEDYKEAVRTAQAWCLFVIFALTILIIVHVLAATGYELWGVWAFYGVAFCHFCVTFLSVLSTVWPAIFFQTLEPCEFNYHTLKQEEGAKIGINQYLFMMTTLCQFVVLGTGAGIPSMDPPPPKVHKYVPVPQRGPGPRSGGPVGGPTY